MTSEQREKRAERNRRDYQRRRSAENADRPGDDCLNGDDSASENGAVAAQKSAAACSKTLAIFMADTDNTSSTLGKIVLENEQDISYQVSPEAVKTQGIKTPASGGSASELPPRGVKTPFLASHHQLVAIVLSLSLVIGITFCLVNEAYRYYLHHDPAMALLKALVGELILLYLALLAPRQWFCWLMVKGLLLVTFAYLAWIISMGLLLSASGDVNKLTQTKAMIGDVEHQIEDKRSELGELTKSGWISRARKVDEQLTGYQQRLFELRSHFAQLGNNQRELIVANVTSLVLFRVILMLTNVVLMGRIRGYGFAGGTKP